MTTTRDAGDRDTMTPMARDSVHRSSLRIRFSSPAEVVDLRHEVLRPGFPRAAAIYPADELPGTRHVVAVDGSGVVVGCATISHEPWEDGSPAWQLRGMAVSPGLRKSGAGRAMLELAEEHTRATLHSRFLWCNARIGAIGFYERLGWRVVSGEFDIPTVGPHVKMVKMS